MATLTFTETIIFKIMTCGNCGIQYSITEQFQNNLRESHNSFYCPNGHSAWYPQDNEAEKLRKELKRKEQELSDVVIEKITISKKLNEADNKLKRLTNGVCPCCNRSFVNLQQHIKKQHPGQVSNKR